MKNQIKISCKDYSQIFPYGITIAYGKNLEISDIIDVLYYKDNYLDLKEIADCKDYGNVTAAVWNNRNNDIYLFINENLTIDVLLHEVNHIAFRVFEIVGSPINDSSEELFCYISQFIFKECYNTITKEFNLKIKLWEDLGARITKE